MKRIAAFAPLLAIAIACGPDSEQDDPPSITDLECTEINDSQSLNGGVLLEDPCYQLSGSLLVTHGELSTAPGTIIRVDSVLTIQTTLFLAPGTTVLFEEGAGLNIDGGLLRADAGGSPDTPIRFIGSHQVSGHWQGLRFANTPAPAFNRLVNVEISHAARSTWATGSSVTRAIIFVDQGGRLELNDAHLSKSAHHGISITEGQLAGCTRVTFENIDRHHVYVGEDGQSCL